MSAPFRRCRLASCFVGLRYLDDSGGFVGTVRTDACLCVFGAELGNGVVEINLVAFDLVDHRES